MSKALKISCNTAARSLSRPSPDEIAALEEAYGPNVEMLPDGSTEVTITAAAE